MCFSFGVLTDLSFDRVSGFETGVEENHSPALDIQLEPSPEGKRGKRQISG